LSPVQVLSAAPQNHPQPKLNIRVYFGFLKNLKPLFSQTYSKPAPITSLIPSLVSATLQTKGLPFLEKHLTSVKHYQEKILRIVCDLQFLKVDFDLNKVGIVGVVLAFIGLFLPWWEINFSVWETVNKEETAMQSAGISVFPYQTSSRNFPASQTIALNMIPFLLFVLPLIVIGILLGTVGSVIDDEEKERILLILAGLLTLFSTILFIFMLQVELWAAPPAPYFFLSYLGQVFSHSLVPIPKVGIFSNGESAFEEASLHYSSYLSIGFWLAVIAAAVMLFASRKHA
jgi:hypothetical protein